MIVNSISGKTPNMIMTANTGGNTVLESYPWTHADDLRPGEAQWVKRGASGALRARATFLFIDGSAGGLHTYSIDQVAPVQEVLAWLQNTAATSAGVYFGLRGDASDFKFLVGIGITAGGDTQLEIWDYNGGSPSLLTSAAYPPGTSDFNTLGGHIHIIDNGERIVLSAGGASIFYDSTERSSDTHLWLYDNNASNTARWDSMVTTTR
jgi:hypothetical protein